MQLINTQQQQTKRASAEETVIMVDEPDAVQSQ